MKLPLPPEHRIGRLEILFAVAVLVLWAGRAGGVWTFNLLLLLLVLAVLYGVLRDVRALARLKASDRSARTMPSGGPVENTRPVRPPAPES